jgi:4-carboxymuconolactone decarboxylase
MGAVSAFTEDRFRFLMEWEFANFDGDSSLDPCTRELVMLAACAALGATAAPVLKLRIESALRAGVPRQQVVDTCIQVGIPAGVPACLAAIEAAAEVFAATEAG